MNSLEYSLRINAPCAVLWFCLTDQHSYRQWSKVFSAESQYEGLWKEGEYIRFVDPSRGGTVALIEKLEKEKFIRMRHVAVISQHGDLDKESAVAKKWIGCLESYFLNEISPEETELRVELAAVHEDFVMMFAETWPKALPLLKELCEKTAYTEKQQKRHI